MKFMHPCAEGHWGHRLGKRGGHHFGKCGHHPKFGGRGKGGHGGCPHHGGHKFGGPHHGGHHHGGPHHGGHHHGGPHHGGPHHGGRNIEHCSHIIRFGPQAEMLHKLGKHHGPNGKHGPRGPHHGPPCKHFGPRICHCGPPSSPHDDRDHSSCHWAIQFDGHHGGCHPHHGSRSRSLSPRHRSGPCRSRSHSPRCGPRAKSPKTTKHFECQTDIPEPTCDHPE